MTLAHKIIGSIVSSSLGFALLKRYAFRTPHAHLYDKDSGEMYMGRWRVVDEVTNQTGYYDCALEWHEVVQKRKLSSRILEALTGYSSIRLHHINRKDHDRDLHSHPFDYRTFVCKGFYAEVFGEDIRPVVWGADGKTRWHRFGPHGRRVIFKGDTQTGSAQKFHRISDVSPGGVWTLFCMTNNLNDWGFLVDDQFVLSRDYFRRKGIRNDGKAADTTDVQGS